VAYAGVSSGSAVILSIHLHSASSHQAAPNGDSVFKIKIFPGSPQITGIVTFEPQHEFQHRLDPRIIIYYQDFLLHEMFSAITRASTIMDPVEQVTAMTYLRT
jgi:hypothetical protein